MIIYACFFIAPMGTFFSFSFFNIYSCNSLHMLEPSVVVPKLFSFVVARIARFQTSFPLSFEACRKIEFGFNDDSNLNRFGKKWKLVENFPPSPPKTSDGKEKFMKMWKQILSKKSYKFKLILKMVARYPMRSVSKLFRHCRNSSDSVHRRATILGRGNSANLPTIPQPRSATGLPEEPPYIYRRVGQKGE